MHPLTWIGQKKRLITFAVLLLLVGCHRQPAPLTEKDVATNYEAGADWGKSYLSLHPDHTFDQIVVRNDGKQTEIHGTWELDLSSGDNRTWGGITFEPFLSVTSENQGKRIGMNLPSISRESDNTIEISADPDHGISFKSK